MVKFTPNAQNPNQFQQHSKYKDNYHLFLYLASVAIRSGSSINLIFHNSNSSGGTKFFDSVIIAY